VITPRCDVPENVTVTNILDEAATVNWDAVANGINYKAGWIETGQTTFNTMQTTSLSKVLTGLDPLTTYDYKMRAECPTGWSVWGGIDVFTTIQCDIPSNVDAINIGSTFAQTIWNAASAASSYEVRFRIKDSADPFTSKINAPNYKWLSNLTPLTAYEYQVRSLCAGISDWSALAFFTTKCEVPSGMTTTNIATDYVKTNWNAIGGIATYNVKYRLKDSSDEFVWKSATSNSKWVINLTPATEYEYLIRSNCAIDNSDWSDTTYFTTNASKMDGSIGSASSIFAHLFPNPADEFIYVNYEIGSDNPAQLAVFDMYGKAIYQRTLSDSETTIRLSTKMWASGHYLLQMKNGMELKSERIMIVK
jgi:hypothetical protein